MQQGAALQLRFRTFSWFVSRPSKPKVKPENKADSATSTTMAMYCRMISPMLMVSAGSWLGVEAEIEKELLACSQRTQP